MGAQRSSPLECHAPGMAPPWPPAPCPRDHPELSEQLCEEMMTRQLECADKVVPCAARGS